MNGLDNCDMLKDIGLVFNYLVIFFEFRPSMLWDRCFLAYCAIEMASKGPTIQLILSLQCHSTHDVHNGNCLDGAALHLLYHDFSLVWYDAK